MHATIDAALLKQCLSKRFCAEVLSEGAPLASRLARKPPRRGGSTGPAQSAMVLAVSLFSATNTHGPRQRYRRPLVLNLPTNHWESAHENIQCKSTNYRTLTYARRGHRALIRLSINHGRNYIFASTILRSPTRKTFTNGHVWRGV